MPKKGWILVGLRTLLNQKNRVQITFILNQNRVIKEKKSNSELSCQNTWRIKKNIFLGIVCLLSCIDISAQCRELIWQDEFDGTTIDLTKWSFQTGASGWGNNELQYYTDRPDNATLSDGKLQIIAKEENYMGANYTSARMRTINKGDWKYGRFEASIKLPGTQGIWPAFWMMPTNSTYGTWPKSGEIDIMEHLGSIPETVFGTVHTASFNHAIGTEVGTQTNNATLESDFHVYALEWSPTQIDVFLDDTKYFTFLNSGNGFEEWPFDQAFHFILNIAVGGNWPGAPDASTFFPQVMEVEYVRVYQQLEELAITGADYVQPFATNASYSLPFVAGAIYNWTVPTGASIMTGQGTPNITVNWGNIAGTVTGSIQSECGTYEKTMDVVLSDNLWQNPDFESDYTNWSTNYYGGAAATFDINTTEAQQGTKAACATVSTVGSQPYNIQLQRKNNTLTVGTSYDLSFWAKADSPGKQISFAFINANTFAWYGGQTLTLTDTWQEYTYTFTPTVDATISFNIDLGRTIGNYCFDNFQLSEPPLCERGDWLILESILPSKLYRASNSIETDGAVVVEANNTVYFQARNHILLKSGFHAKANSVFVAKIEDCQPMVVINRQTLPILENSTTSSSPNVSSLSVYPNPSSGVASIKIELIVASTAELFVYDLYGQVQAQIFSDQKLGVGIHSFSLNSPLLAGTYFLVLKTERVYLSEKIIILEQ